MRLSSAFVISCVVLGATGFVVARAQQPPAAGFTRTPVQQADLSVPGRQVVQVMAEIQPGAESGRHTHPGEEVTYVFEGALTLEVQGKPTVVKKAGEAFIVPPNTVHNAKNAGSVAVKALATYIVDKAKPVSTPVSQ